MCPFFFPDSHGCLKLRDFIPSIPAVFFPAFSCDTCRTASNLAALDFRISFCRFLARRLSPAWMALNNLLCNRKRFFLSFFQGIFFQSSLYSVLLPMCLTMIYSVNRFLFASKQLRFVLPESRDFSITPVPTQVSTISWDSLIRFYSFRPMIDCPFRWNHFDYRKPLIMSVIPQGADGLHCSDEVRGYYSFCFPAWTISHFSRFCFIVGTPITPVSPAVGVWLRPIPCFSLQNSEFGHWG